jgi:formylglycine-generating enzyme required for sulfatase activity
LTEECPLDDQEVAEDRIEDKNGRVWRGGAYNNNPGQFHSAFRNQNLPASRNWDFGFRPARTQP